MQDQAVAQWAATHSSHTMQVVSLWIWLSFRFDNFHGQEEAIKTAETVVDLMEISLVRLGTGPHGNCIPQK